MDQLCLPWLDFLLLSAANKLDFETDRTPMRRHDTTPGILRYHGQRKSTDTWPRKKDIERVRFGGGVTVSNGATA